MARARSTSSFEKTVYRTFETQDMDSASGTLAVAFNDDPIMRTLNPDDKHWATAGPKNFAWFCWIYHKSFGMTEVAEDSDMPGDIECAALWEPAAMTVGAGLRFLLYLMFVLWSEGFTYVRRMFAMFMQLETKRHEHAPTAHHLMALGSKVQGNGVGSKLIQIGIDRATAAGVPCYLESSNPRNVPFYERHGFKIVEEMYPFETDTLVDGKGPVATLMLRDLSTKKCM